MSRVHLQECMEPLLAWRLLQMLLLLVGLVQHSHRCPQNPHQKQKC